MVAVRPDPTVSRSDTIDGAGATAGEALKSSGESAAVVRFDHEMEVISLNGEMDDAEVGSMRASERVAEDGEDPFRSQGWQPAIGTESDQDGMAAIVLLPRDVPDAREPSVWFATRSGPTTTPCGRRGKRELSRRPACHLDLALFRPGRADVASMRADSLEGVPAGEPDAILLWHWPPKGPVQRPFLTSSGVPKT